MGDMHDENDDNLQGLDNSMDLSDNEEKHYKLERINETISRKYNVEEITFRAKFNTDLEGQRLLNVTDELHGMFDEVLETVRSEHPDPNDKARLSIKHSGLERDIVIHCRPQHALSPDIILDR